MHDPLELRIPLRRGIEIVRPRGARFVQVLGNSFERRTRGAPVPSAEFVVMAFLWPACTP